MYWILYFISVFIVYIILRYLVISNKYGFIDDPQIITFLLSLFWPIFLVIFVVAKCGDYIDKFIKSKLNN